MNKEKKQNKYLYKADGKSLSLKNTKNKENSKQCNDFQNKIKKKRSETNKQSVSLDKRYLCNYRWFFDDYLGSRVTLKFFTF